VLILRRPTKKSLDNAGIASSKLSSTGTQAGIFNQNGQISIDPRQILGSGLVPGTQGLAIYGSITDAIRVFVRAVDTRDKLNDLGAPGGLYRQQQARRHSFLRPAGARPRDHPIERFDQQHPQYEQHCSGSIHH